MSQVRHHKRINGNCGWFYGNSSKGVTIVKSLVLSFRYRLETLWILGAMQKEAVLKKVEKCFAKADGRAFMC